jgi:arabinofuranosyltransferase
VRRLLPLFAAALAVASALIWADHLRLVAIDDAYISFRAAMNLAHGFGPVFNPGERVESSTSPLWVAVLAAAERLGAGPLATWAPLSLLFAAAAAAFSALCAFELGGPVAAVLATIALTLTPAFGAWICTGMEVPLAAFLITASAWAAIRQRAIAAGLLLALAAMARPEAIVLLPVLLLAVPRSSFSRLIAAALLPTLALLLLRHAFFGQWLPNTYVAKRGGAGLAGILRGLLYVGGFALGNVLLVAAAVRGAFRRGPPRALAFACIVFAAAIAWDGGDHFPLDRLLSPIVPLACALLGFELGTLPRKALPAAAGLALLVPLGISESLHTHSPFRGPRAMAGLVDFTAKIHGVQEGLALLPPGRVATVSIGIIGYESGRNILDLVGLAEPHIARSPHLEGVAQGHDHSDVDYVLAQKPEFALFGPQLSPVTVTTAMEEAWLNASDQYFRAGRLLQGDPRFRAAYRPLDVLVPGGRHLRIWQLRR